MRGVFVFSSIYNYIHDSSINKKPHQILYASSTQVKSAYLATFLDVVVALYT